MLKNDIFPAMESLRNQISNEEFDYQTLLHGLGNYSRPRDIQKADDARAAALRKSQIVTSSKIKLTSPTRYPGFPKSFKFELVSNMRSIYDALDDLPSFSLWAGDWPEDPSDLAPPPPSPASQHHRLPASKLPCL